MSEESKSDYVTMADNAPSTLKVDGLDDPNLSQEDKDLRLAIALQQQENAAAYNAHKKKNENAKHAKQMRTTRSGAHTGLAAIRKKHGGVKPEPQGDYIPGGSSDYEFAKQICNVEATTARIQNVISTEDEDKKAIDLRTVRSAHSGRAKKN